MIQVSVLFCAWQIDEYWILVIIIGAGLFCLNEYFTERAIIGNGFPRELAKALN